MADYSEDNDCKGVSGCAGASVLVVDDNQTIAQAVRRILEQDGWRVMLCFDGAEALRQIEKELPAAAVVDIHLPDISGLVLSSKLRQSFGPGRRIIILSGDTSMANLHSLPHGGATCFI